MSKLPPGFRPMRDERPWYEKTAEALALRLDHLLAHSPTLTRFLKQTFASRPRPPSSWPR